MIFIHSGFRTSSTYIWSKFRERPNTIAYCEIFNELMSYANRDLIRTSTRTTWHSKHPGVAPYFVEFIPLLRENGGIVGFDPSFCYERYVPEAGPAGPISDPEAAYVRGLIDHAERSGKIPVLTATRSLGRVAGLKAAAPGYHVLLYRNLFQQWCSYTEQAQLGNSFFLMKSDAIVQGSQHDPFLRNLVELFPVKTTSARDIDTFYRFLFSHVYLYAHAAGAVDLILDVTRLTDDRAYRQHIEHCFGTQAVTLDLSDAKDSIAYSLVEIPDPDEFRQWLRVVGSIIQASVPHEAGRTFAAKALDDLTHQLTRNTFHTHALRSLLDRSFEEQASALAAAEDARAERATLLTAEAEAARSRDAACEDRDAARASEGMAVQALERALAERDAAETAARLAERALEDARATCRDAQSLSADAQQVSANALAGRDAALAERDMAKAAQADLRARLDAAARDADRVGQEARAHRDRIEAERTTALAQRDAVRDALAAARAEREALQARYDGFVRWSLAYHDSTAASASWRLTRPLRWIGIGRPRRPPKPDVL